MIDFTGRTLALTGAASGIPAWCVIRIISRLRAACGLVAA